MLARDVIAVMARAIPSWRPARWPALGKRAIHWAPRAGKRSALHGLFARAMTGDVGRLRYLGVAG